MAENYPIGIRRIFYRASGFQEGLEVTMDVLSPLLTWELGLHFTEAGRGLYFFDMDFFTEGSFAVILYEDGVKKTSQNFLAKDREKIYSFNSTSRGPSVINTCN